MNKVDEVASLPKMHSADRSADESHARAAADSHTATQTGASPRLIIVDRLTPIAATAMKYEAWYAPRPIPTRSRRSLSAPPGASCCAPSA